MNRLKTPIAILLLTLFLAGERPGGEDVAFSGIGKRFAGGMGGGVHVTVHVEGSVTSDRDLIEKIKEGLTRSLTLTQRFA